MFSCMDTITDSEYIYDSIIKAFEDPKELLEVKDLLIWWNQ